MRSLQAADQLGAIFYDECHVHVTNEDFRTKAITAVHTVSALNAPKVFLSATIPKGMEDELERLHRLTIGVRIRVCTVQARVSYERCYVEQSGTIPLKAVELAKDLKEEHGENFRGLICARTKDECEAMATMMGCYAYHARKDARERKGGLEQWSKGRVSWMVGTSAIFQGLTNADLDAVILAGLPYGGLIDFVQASGRCGRGEREGRAILVVNEKIQDSKRKPTVKWKLQDEMVQWTRSENECLRQKIGIALDGTAHECKENPAWARCGVCNGREQRMADLKTKKAREEKRRECTIRMEEGSSSRTLSRSKAGSRWEMESSRVEGEHRWEAERPEFTVGEIWGRSRPEAETRWRSGMNMSEFGAEDGTRRPGSRMEGRWSSLDEADFGRWEPGSGSRTTWMGSGRERRRSGCQRSVGRLLRNSSGMTEASYEIAPASGSSSHGLSRGSSGYYASSEGGDGRLVPSLLKMSSSSFPKEIMGTLKGPLKLIIEGCGTRQKQLQLQASVVSLGCSVAKMLDGKCGSCWANYGRIVGEHEKRCKELSGFHRFEISVRLPRFKFCYCCWLPQWPECERVKWRGHGRTRTDCELKKGVREVLYGVWKGKGRMWNRMASAFGLAEDMSEEAYMDWMVDRGREELWRKRGPCMVNYVLALVWVALEREHELMIRDENYEEYSDNEAR